eukprot:TRINITY_DN5386_c0_g1_i10.p1 TRINITY_DN5386_c0_g1~~TRINITY_DN5386_c0_g1_i10.p1  ORF type:complete len:183 (-),score=40.31 TRINITY_DN5386_c0_g1_i10:117-665(-)
MSEEESDFASFSNPEMETDFSQTTEVEKDKDKAEDVFSGLDRGSTEEDAPLDLETKREEPVEETPKDTPLSRWEEKRAVILKERQEKAQADKDELLLKAKEELDAFHEKRKQDIEKIKKTNRQEEKTEAKDMAVLMETGTRWQKVNKMVDLKPKKDPKEAAKTDRMRVLIGQLKTQKDPDEK